MRNVFRKKTGVQTIEQALETVLIPVEISPAFLTRLEAQLRSLSTAPQIVVPAAPVNRPKFALLGLAGAFSALMLVATGFRTVATILGAVGILNELHRELKAKKPAPPLTTAL